MSGTILALQSAAEATDGMIWRIQWSSIADHGRGASVAPSMLKVARKFLMSLPSLSESKWICAPRDPHIDAVSADTLFLSTAETQTLGSNIRILGI